MACAGSVGGGTIVAGAQAEAAAGDAVVRGGAGGCVWGEW
jgi:hypothetical protein